MQLPENTIIDKRKLTGYLLKFQEKDDKSKFLGKAGYTLDNWELLENDLRLLLKKSETFFAHATKFGDYYEIVGELHRPNQTVLRVKTIWMKERFSDRIKFITLFPYK
ncbi:MAG: hypothetical protein HY960_16175 [Ignavibacteriae bacterium]|nr:hypothetical protein [Ignavibacteriota bacterium]